MLGWLLVDWPTLSASGTWITSFKGALLLPELLLSFWCSRGGSPGSAPEESGFPSKGCSAAYRACMCSLSWLSLGVRSWQWGFGICSLPEGGDKHMDSKNVRLGVWIRDGLSASSRSFLTLYFILLCDCSFKENVVLGLMYWFPSKQK